jgi:ABC-type sugar transport system permease subunit
MTAGIAHVRADEPQALDNAELNAAKRRWWWRRAAVGYGFLAPVLIFFGVFLLVPIASVIRQSFMQGGVLGPAVWVGLDNWRGALSDPKFLRALGNTVLYTALTVPTVLILAMLLAILLREIRRGSWLARTIVYLPSLAPVVLAGLIWQFVVSPEVGLATYGAELLGAGTVNWLGNERLALPTIAALDVWRGVGFWALFLLAALLAVPKDLYQAAELDGAGALARFRYVTLPGIRSTVGVAIVIATLFSMQIFDSVYVLTRGGPAGSTETAVLYIYNSVFQSGNPGYGAVLSLVLMVLIVLLTVIISKFIDVSARRGA